MNNQDLKTLGEKGVFTSYLVLLMEWRGWGGATSQGFVGNFPACFVNFNPFRKWENGSEDVCERAPQGDLLRQRQG